ncbi:MAG TPA: FAD-dependent monooxygenase [Ignavibacteriaceae bacterium]|nr:FAD-dependent monooxygenase [Ignavibacteriaceae bacterium]
MKKQIELNILPDKINDLLAIKSIAARELQVETSEITAVIPLKRSIDARRYHPIFKLLCDIYINEQPNKIDNNIHYQTAGRNKKVIIVGSGPGGMFAALRLIELGIKPVIIERGKDVQSRRRDLKAIQQDHVVNPDSNYCFGEGGAGTYSDGKLYTRSTKRGDIKKILNILVQHGSSQDILVDAHPHIGSNNLPKIVQAVRDTIINCGGEVHFNSRVTDFILNNKRIIGVVANDREEYTGDAVILATGHSARDVYYLLHKKNIKIEPKPFAMGVRIEHPQQLIDEIMYHSKIRHENLPAASYNTACDVNGRGVYSFCMCPGGIVVPAATAPGEIVVNGMSLSRRDSPFANSGFVVSVDEKDWNTYESDFPFSGLKLQMEIEQLAFQLGGGTQTAPAQRVTDFIHKKISANLPQTSYIPGVIPAPLHEALPEFIVQGLSKALMIFDKKMNGYYTEEAQLIAAETRTSSPIRIPRDKETFMHIEIEGLFPCGEGAGYAGGIVSSAIDGENCADAAAKFLK